MRDREIRDLLSIEDGVRATTATCTFERRLRTRDAIPRVWSDKQAAEAVERAS